MNEDTLDIEGAAHQEQYAEFVCVGRDRVLIKGFPACPECGYTLSLGYIKERWLCRKCSTNWSSVELVNAINKER